MARPGDIPKSEKKKEQLPEVKYYVEKEVDSYGFKKTMAQLEKNNFVVDKINGMIYIRLNEKDNFKECYSKIEQIILKEKFKGSWGVCY